MMLLFTRAIFTLLVAGMYFLAPLPVQAQTDWNDACVKDVTVQGGTVITDVATIQGVECLVANILSVATSFIGLASFVMIIIGAFLYMTSGSSSKGTEAAKQTFTYAIIGIIVALMAFFVLTLISNFTGVTGFLDFNLNIGN